MKIIPLMQMKLDSNVKHYLNGGAKRDQVSTLIDYRTPFYALKDNHAIPPLNSRISGLRGGIPVNRVDIVKRCYAAIEPAIRHNEDYVQGEKKFIAYAHSPRSIRLGFSKIMKSAIDPYYNNAKEEFSPKVKQALIKALGDWEEQLRKRIPKGSLRPGSLDKVMEKIPKTTNGGAPYFKQGRLERKNKQTGKVEVIDNRPLYKSIAERLLNTGQINKEQNAFGSIGRGQETSDDKRVDGMVISKQRRPWAEGHAGTLIGGMLYPYYIKRASFPVRAALVNQLEVDRVIASNGTNKGDGVVSGDGSAFDTHMNPGLGKQIGNVILDSFTLSKDQRRALELYFEHVFEDPLITPVGLIEGKHGMPSGTTITNELDSNYNEVLCLAVKYISPGVNLEMVTAQGDDAIMNIRYENDELRNKYKDPEDVKEGLSSVYKELLMDVNPKKNMVSKYKCEFLKRLHIKGTTESYRSYCGSVIGMCNMERPKDGKYPMYISRTIYTHYQNSGRIPGIHGTLEGSHNDLLLA